MPCGACFAASRSRRCCAHRTANCLRVLASGSNGLIPHHHKQFLQPPWATMPKIREALMSLSQEFRTKGSRSRPISLLCYKTYKETQRTPAVDHVPYYSIHDHSRRKTTARARKTCVQHLFPNLYDPLTIHQGHGLFFSFSVALFLNLWLACTPFGKLSARPPPSLCAALGQRPCPVDL